jgi:FMN phosphatase YigB (HAD superfamily)
MKIKAIIFDQDETLIHPNTGLYEQYVLERAKDFAKVFGIKNINQAKKMAFKMKIEKCEDSTIKLYDLMKIPRSVWYDKLNLIDVEPFLRVDLKLKQFLSKLKNNGLLIFLLTNSPTLQTKKILETVGLSNSIFDHIFTWERGKEPPKPSRKPFAYIFKKFGIKSEECIMVGNEIKVDLRVAHSLHIHTVGINLETRPDENVDHTVNDLDDLFSIINLLEENNL